MVLETELFQTYRRLRANDPTLTILNLCQDDIANNDVSRLSEALTGNTHLVVMMLTGNLIGDRGATRLALSLLPSSKVQYLYLGKNNIGERGALALSQLTQLKILDLRYNSVGCEGAKHLAKLLLDESSSLQSLVLTHNGIQEEGMRRVAEALRDNSSLQYLHLAENDCTPAAVYDDFKGVCRVNTTLQSIALGDDGIPSKNCWIYTVWAESFS